MAGLWEAAYRLDTAARTASSHDEHRLSMQSEYRHYADLEASLRSAFVATPHLVRFVTLTAEFRSQAWAATHAPVTWQKEQAIERLEAARDALFAAFEEEGVDAPTPRVPLGMAVQMQQQIDEEAAAKEGSTRRNEGQSGT